MREASDPLHALPAAMSALESQPALLGDAVLSELPAALDHGEDGIRVAEKHGDRCIQTTGHAAVAQANCGLGLWQRAIDHGRR